MVQMRVPSSSAGRAAARSASPPSSRRLTRWQCSGPGARREGGQPPHRRCPRPSRRHQRLAAPRARARRRSRLSAPPTLVHDVVRQASTMSREMTLAPEDGSRPVTDSQKRSRGSRPCSHSLTGSILVADAAFDELPALRCRGRSGVRRQRYCGVCSSGLRRERSRSAVVRLRTG